VPPLCVDLDGTLVRTDLPLESLLSAVRKDVSLVPRLSFTLLRGRAALKAAIADQANLDPALLPYNDEVVAFVKEQRTQGRRIVLASASHRRLVEKVAEYLGLFDEIEATDGGTDFKGTHRAERLVARFGEKGFDYIGNSAADIPVWLHARHSFVAAMNGSVTKRLSVSPDVSFSAVVPRPWDFLRAMRVHQWVKNLLIFAVLIAAHSFSDVALWARAGLAFFAFALCASSVYILNDLLDLEADRRHPRKRERPFAAGRLPVTTGVAMAPSLLIAAAILAAALPYLFALVLALYYLTTCAYSVWLKRIVLVDVFALASLYTLRLIAGAAAVAIVPSFWLLAFAMFLFLSLAMVKRYAELVQLRGGDLEAAFGRGYYVIDRDMLAGLGVGSAFAAVLVLALYINSESVVHLYRLPEAIWLLCPLLLYWLSRLWIVARRGKLDDDPIVFALRDRVSRIVIGLSGVVFLLAAFGPRLYLN
jgi:4-hydroxybenzoate polyprenyltransferase/phosphoserine phosphatase